MLVFTVFSTITWNSLFHYKDGKAQMANNWNLSKSFKRRFHEDMEFRRTFCVFADRCCLVATFIVYLVSFCVICTQSSSSTYGTLDTLDPILAAQADLVTVDMLRQDWLGSRNGSSS
jgi:hypothetical protein